MHTGTTIGSLALHAAAIVALLLLLPKSLDRVRAPAVVAVTMELAPDNRVASIHAAQAAPVPMPEKPEALPSPAAPISAPLPTEEPPSVTPPQVTTLAPAAVSPVPPPSPAPKAEMPKQSPPSPQAATARDRSVPVQHAARSPASAHPATTADAPAVPAAVAALIPPRPVAGMSSNRPPIYPEGARRRGIQGRVLLRISVSAEGAPVAVSIAQSSGAATLDDAAVAAVRQWRFVPASQGNRSIAGTAEVPIEFKLEQ
jgi:protein TonB